VAALLSRACVLVARDLMLDRYCFGDVKRIFPEADSAGTPLVPTLLPDRDVLHAHHALVISDDAKGALSDVATNRICCAVRRPCSNPCNRMPCC
jgi:bifunctional ADP-heptose synthase (sugar kinase/adenylyltransferase)